MKFFYASAAILASSIATVSGQSTVGNWDITYNNTETNFVAGAANDITVKYLISTGRNYTAEVFDKDCSTAIDTSVLIGKEDVLTTGSPEDLLEVKLNIDKSAITTSNIWDATNELIEFCVKVQLKSELGSVIKYENREITVDIDTDIEYTAVNDVEVTNPDTSPGTGGATANVDTYVSACKCDMGSFQCNTNPISSSNTLSVCIKSSSDDVELMDLTSLDLLQAVTNEAMSVVLNNAAVESSLSTIIPGKTTRFIETIVPTRFFQAEENIVVSGVIEVQLKGTGTRRLNLSQLSLDTAGGTRAMREESVAVIRPGLLDDDDEEEFVFSDFGFPVGLVADLAEVPTSSGLAIQPRYPPALGSLLWHWSGVAIIVAICQAFSY